MTLRPEEVERFKNDPEYFDRVRHMLENSMNVSNPFLFSSLDLGWLRSAEDESAYSRRTRSRSGAARCRTTSRRCSGS